MKENAGAESELMTVSGFPSEPGSRYTLVVTMPPLAEDPIRFAAGPREPRFGHSRAM